MDNRELESEDIKPNVVSNEIAEEKCDFAGLLNECIYDEVKERIYNKDPHALAILVNAKLRLRDKISNVKDNIKYIALILKPFYLVCLISVLMQRPDSI
ncbi:MAG: hypothetical protein AB7V56_09565 [Candidatus Nitrosocosmicus sp.]|jgi:hypothetical protein|uniref:hypothetical protein n=1 Tax=Candidatus Nitrosocosmicus agrestis TaxID=2563600 RepID=UPI00122E3E7F|nr:hypothetical protein [Candidatus Nitrosocosmicus sp. SS]KAA2279144.1 hypothetical protein F1Z66_14100 [Candidatus Nitrosocosmicus sp. SS]KAF0867672.1 hypothetical protein E5N71_14125 [Candidatus Nitrosocosmicus sp. SS]MDR4491241.1 hypothetical protein [Candidatus Nitrosocosmicus sp.]